MSKVPTIVFIVPYRNRPQQKYFLSTYLSAILKDVSYEIYFSHQCDVRTFNRGAAKNIGFLAVKQKYPEHYKDITFVFNDVDTVPFSDIFHFETTPGVVKHFYGFEYALGGIVAFRGSDFELVNGYPNFWGWGMEDNVLQTRCGRHSLTIDRTQFFKIGHPNVLHLFDGVSRIINRKDPWRATHDNGNDGIRTIHKLQFSIDLISTNPDDNHYLVENERIFMVNIATFLTEVPFEHNNYYSYDLRQPLRQIVHPSKIKSKQVNFVQDDWTNIPFYPTAEQKKEMVTTYGQQKTDEIIEYNAAHSNTPTIPLVPKSILKSQQPHHHNNQHPHHHNNQHPHHHNNQHPHHHNQHHQPHHNGRPLTAPPHRYSPEYAAWVNAKPRATPSAFIRLGGVVARIK